MNRLLFVDDQREVLEFLRRLLAHMSDEWTMEFVGNAEEALAALA
ncbi:MAG: hypothetical protein AB1555_16020 [Nitrospirota bacterium]